MPSAINHYSSQNDLLSAVLAELQLRSTQYRRVLLRSPWALSFSGSGRGIHIIGRGRCELVTANGVVALEAGDLAILTSGLEHTLRSFGAPRKTRVIPAADYFAAPLPRTDEKHRGDETEVICGLFEFGAADHPLLRSLSPLVHLRNEERRRSAHLKGYVDALADEVALPREGSAAIVKRISEVLVVEALRLHAERRSECPQGGWFQATHDPALHRVLAAIHGQLGAAWSVAALAKVAGQSRSVFARRFHEVLKESPMAYLGRWRMFRARQLLREGHDGLEAVATAVGYASANAFSLAFQRIHGTTPGRYRTAPEI